MAQACPDAVENFQEAGAWAEGLSGRYICPVVTISIPQCCSLIQCGVTPYVAAYLNFCVI